MAWTWPLARWPAGSTPVRCRRHPRCRYGVGASGLGRRGRRRSGRPGLPADWCAPGPAGLAAPVATELVSRPGRWVRGPGALAWLGHGFARRRARPQRRSWPASARPPRPPGPAAGPGRRRVGLRACALPAWTSPYGMYFDEVYHARTATEFLQDWRYGKPHAIYEYTHPAPGQVPDGAGHRGCSATIGSRHEPTSATPCDGRRHRAPLEPSDGPAERDGDRLYVATGSSTARLRPGSTAPDVSDASRMAATARGGRPRTIAHALRRRLRTATIAASTRPASTRAGDAAAGADRAASRRPFATPTRGGAGSTPSSTVADDSLIASSR